MQAKSSVVKRSVIIDNHKTSVSVEDLFWGSLKRIAAESEVTISELVGRIDKDRVTGNLSSALRTFVLGYYRRRCGDEGLGFSNQAAAMLGGRRTGDLAAIPTVNGPVRPL